MTTAQLNDFFIAGQDCLAFTPAALSMSATSVNFANGAAVGAVGWDAASVATSYIAASANVLVLTTGLGGSSSGLIAGGDSAIMVRTQATLNVPLPLGAINPTYTFSSTAFARPRLGFIVKLN